MIKDNIFKIKERIVQACSKVKRDPQEITVVAVAKGRTIDEIKEASDAGTRDIGENKVQEALLKYKHLTPNTCNLTPIKWHMVGHLQTNKVKDALKMFDLMHSVDSLHLAQEINKQAAKINKIQDILVEVNASGEAAKFGLRPEETIGIIQEISEFKNINIRGLMTIAPLVDNPEESRPYFRKLRDLRDRINELNRQNRLNELNILSMGMSDDFEVAIKEGATMVRLGRAIFES